MSEKDKDDVIRNLILLLRRFAYLARNDSRFDDLRKQTGDYLIKNNETQGILRTID